MTGLWVLLGVLALCTVFGLVQRSRSGRFRPVGSRPAAARPAAAVTAAAGTTSDVAPDQPADAATSPRTSLAAPAAGQPTAGQPAGQPAAGQPTAQPATAPTDEASLHDVLAALGEQPGERATLLQFSSAFCAPCRATRRILGEVAELIPGVRHVEVDAEQHLDVVRRLKIMKTPTTLVLDADAKITARATGQPRKTEVLNALGHAVP
jgi:thiol-disulfide isomerase/thioredoxin